MQGVIDPSPSALDEGQGVFLTERDEEEPAVLDLPIDGVLDLHTFRPQDAASVVEEYLRTCVEKGIPEVKIIHGKGKGTLRRTVHAVLDRHPSVLDFSLDGGPSGWGATIAHLKRPVQ